MSTKFKGEIFMTKNNQNYKNMLGQDTGYKDINNKEIHCGDIIKYPKNSGSDIFYVGKVKFGEWYQDGSGDEYAPVLCCGFYIERQNKKCIFPNRINTDDIDEFYLQDYDEEQSLAMIAKDRDYGNIEIIEEINKPHAHWKEDGTDYYDDCAFYKCINCNRLLIFSMDDLTPDEYGYRFCPYCGCKR